MGWKHNRGTVKLRMNVKVLVEAWMTCHFRWTSLLPFARIQSFQVEVSQDRTNFFEFIVRFYDHDLTWFMNCKYQSGWTLEEESKTLPSFFLPMKISQVGSFRLLWPYFVGALAEQLKGQIWKSNSKVD